MDRGEKLSINNESGQLTIFLGLSMALVMTFLAFIINVGLFVKAKINLQNAVDAAAFAGASVQARQLTNISYVNWEMRNTYKEWVFKQYVLGQKGLYSSIENQLGGAGNQMNFRLKTFYRDTDGAYFDANIFDPYNLPSICIHFGSPHNICGIASIPGLPRFETLGISGISEENESFLNAIVKTKANDCSTRTNLNFGTAMMWAFGDGSGTLFPDVPEIAARRPGAWPQAFELGIRMRNLESIVNRPPIQEVCQDPSICSKGIDTIRTEGAFGERTYKAFASAVKNLGGKEFREDCSQGTADHMSCSFKMTELTPNPVQTDNTTLSGLLLPADASAAFQKHYLDLIAYPVNFVSFYSMFLSSTGAFKNSGTNSEAECGILKTGIPVPAYLLGFVKNPNVMTYYAVKGKAKFVGMLYPFSDRGGIELTAYAAAKPFGGRIGPRIFIHDPNSANSKQIKPRTAAMTSSAYLMGLNTNGLSSGFKPGFPIPTVQDFWVSDPSAVVGGSPQSNATPKFSVPNLFYEFADANELNTEASKISPILIAERAITWNEADSSTLVREDRGLFNKSQFRQFWRLQNSSGGSVMSADDVEKTLERVRAPTRYEALNYMIPNFVENGAIPSEFDTYPSFINKSTDPTRVQYQIYAPLFGPNFPHDKDVAGIINEVNTFITSNSAAVQRFLDTLKEIRDQMIAESSAATSSDAYVEAANSIYREPLDVTGAPTDPECQNLSMAQQFAIFFRGNGEQCGIKPIVIYTNDYFEGRKTDPSYQNYYTGIFRRTIDGETAPFDPRVLQTGYSPGRRQGAQEDGQILNVVGAPVGLARRNYYSAKLIPVDEYLMNSSGGTGILTMGLLHEKDEGQTLPDIDRDFSNKLDPGVLGEFKKIDF